MSANFCFVSQIETPWLGHLQRQAASLCGRPPADCKQVASVLVPAVGACSSCSQSASLRSSQFTCRATAPKHHELYIFNKNPGKVLTTFYGILGHKRPDTGHTHQCMWLPSSLLSKILAASLRSGQFTRRLQHQKPMIFERTPKIASMWPSLVQRIAEQKASHKPPPCLCVRLLSNFVQEDPGSLNLE